MAMNLTNRGATTQPIVAPTITARSELMMRLRSSTRCSKNVICPPVSASGTGELVAVGSSWLLLVMSRRVTNFRCGRCFWVHCGFFSDGRGEFWGRVRFACHRFTYRSNRRLNRFNRFRQNSRCFRFGSGGSGRGGLFRGCSCRRGGFLRLLPLKLACLPFDVAHLLLERHLKVGGRLAELRHQFAQSTGKLRQLVRAKEHQHYHEQDDDMGNAKHEWSRAASLPLFGIIESA